MKIYSRVLDGHLAGFYLKDVKGVITDYQLHVNLDCTTTAEFKVFFESYVSTKDIVKTEGVTEACTLIGSGDAHVVSVVFPCPENLVGLSGYVSAGVDSQVVSSVEEI